MKLAHFCEDFMKVCQQRRQIGTGFKGLGRTKSRKAREPMFSGFTGPSAHEPMLRFRT